MSAIANADSGATCEAKVEKARLHLGRLQSEHRDWLRRQPFYSTDWHDPLMGLVEEVGELHHALLKQKQKIRGTYEEHEEKAKDAIGDILIYLSDLCNRRGWCAQEILEKTWGGIVQKRDFAQNSATG